MVKEAKGRDQEVQALRLEVEELQKGLLAQQEQVWCKGCMGGWSVVGGMVFHSGVVLGCRSVYANSLSL